MAMRGELFKNLKRKPATLRFPYERDEQAERIRAMVAWEIEKCIGCTLCAKICPSNAIEIEGIGEESEIIYNVGKCIFCGECVDICPTDAISTTKQFELAYTRIDQMVNKYNRPKKETEASTQK